MRDLERLKKKQLSLASSGVVKSLGELLKDVGGVAVVRGQGEHREVVNVEAEQGNRHLESEAVNEELITTDDPLSLEMSKTITEEEEETEAVTYVVDGETGEILMIDKDVSEPIDFNEECFETESITGPLDGRVMEIDSSSKIHLK